jgi:hypothetical protein
LEETKRHEETRTLICELPGLCCPLFWYSSTLSSEIYIPQVESSDKINEANRVIPNSSGLKPSQKDMKQAVKNFYNKTSPIFQKTYNANLGECLSKVSDLNIQHQTKNEIRKKRGNQYRESKQSVDNQMQETAFLR